MRLKPSTQGGDGTMEVLYPILVSLFNEYDKKSEQFKIDDIVRRYKSGEDSKNIRMMREYKVEEFVYPLKRTDKKGYIYRVQLCRVFLADSEEQALRAIFSYIYKWGEEQKKLKRAANNNQLKQLAQLTILLNQEQ